MKRTLDEGTVRSIYRTLLERFGEPLGGDGQGVPTSKRKEDMGNRGFGAKLAEMEVGGRHPGHGSNCRCPDCLREPPTADMKLSLDEDELGEVAPPGWEGTVKAMKKHPEIDNPWALAWHMKGKGAKSHRTKSGKQKDESVFSETRLVVGASELQQTWEDLYAEMGAVSLEDLASWLGVTEEATLRGIEDVGFLMVDPEGYVVEKGLSGPHVMPRA